MQDEIGQWLPQSQNTVNLCFSNSVLPSQMDSSIEPHTRTFAVVSSEKESANSVVVGYDARSIEGVDLNRTHVQKPKRKKHRPKVIKEGKPAKASKSTTPKLPKEKREQPSSKRKYVRRKRPNTPAGQPPPEGADSGIRADLKPAKHYLNFDVEDLQENAHPGSQVQVTEISTALRDSQSSISTGQRNALVQAACHLGATTSSVYSSADPMANVQELHADSTDKGAMFDLNCSINQIQSEHANFMDSSAQFLWPGTRETLDRNQLLYLSAGIPDKSVPPCNISVNQMQNGSTNVTEYLFSSQDSTTETPRTNQMLHGCVMPENRITPPQHIEWVSMSRNLYPKACTREAEIINQPLPGYRIAESPMAPLKHIERDSLRENLNEVAMNNDYLKFVTNSNSQRGAVLHLHDSCDSSDILAIGTKREHSVINGTQCLLDMNFDHPNGARTFFNDSHATSSQISYFPERCKKMRTENHNSWLNGVVGDFSSSPSYFSSTWNTNKVSAINQNVFTLSDAQRLIAIEKSRASERMQGFGLSRNDMVKGPNMVHNRPCLHDSTNDFISSPDKQFRYMAAEHTILPSSPINPLGEKYIPRSGIHQLQSLEHHMVKGPNLSAEPHSTFPLEDAVNDYCIAPPDKQIRSISLGLPTSPVTPLSSSTGNGIPRTENSQLEASRETTAAKPNEKPKVRRRSRKEAKPGGEPKVRGRPRKEKVVDAKQASSKGSHTYLLKHEDISCVSGHSAVMIPGQRAVDSEKNGERASCILAASGHDYSSSASSKQIHGESISEVITPLEDTLDVIIQKIKLLDINKLDVIAAAKPQNALVPYNREFGAMVPYEGKVKKRHSRAKVNLDPVTTLMWKLLMGPDMSDGTEGMDKDKEKWLDEERRIFQGRVDSFIARMHLVQGDRRFSPWKGSVVDSVVGVFLTQNVSDHLSSSAFMALAAKFPVKSEGPEKPAAGMFHASPQQKDSCCGQFGDAIKLQEKFFVEEISDKGSLITTAENEGSNSNELFGSSSPDGAVDCSAGVHSNSYRKSLIGLHESGLPGTIFTGVGSGSAVEVEDGPLEDVVSSQNSVVSSQSSPDYLLRTTDHMGCSSLPNFAANDLIVGNMTNNMGSSTLYTELLRIQDLQSKSNEKIGSSGYHGVTLLPVPVVDKSTVRNEVYNLSGAHQSAHSSLPYLQNGQINVTGVPYANHLDNSFYTGLDRVDDYNSTQYESNFYPLSSASSMAKQNKIKMADSVSSMVYGIDESLRQKSPFPAEPSQGADSISPIINQYVPLHSSETLPFSTEWPFCDNSLLRNKTDAPFVKQHVHSKLQEECTTRTKQMGGESFQSRCSQQEDDVIVQTTCGKHCSSNLCESQKTNSEVLHGVDSEWTDKSKDAQMGSSSVGDGSKAKKVMAGTSKRKIYDWDSLRKEVLCDGGDKGRGHDAKDSVDWEAIRQADVSEISETIRERGMNNKLAERIKEFLSRLVRDHGSIDLEWLRAVQPDKAKDYLLSIRGIGLKSVECVRLLTLHHMAFPVDTNVGRICVRLGWVPLQPLPESLQLHLLELYPMLENIQKYLWPRLCKLDQRTLYELHYQMITFGKVFCTKSKPNCNSCPMRAECKHFASAFASARLALPGPEEKGLVASGSPIAAERCHQTFISSRSVGQVEWNTKSLEHVVFTDRQPIIEEPASPEPEPESAEAKEGAIEDVFIEDPDEIPTLKLNIEEFTQNLKSYMQANNIKIEDADMSKALVAITPEAASIPTPKLKNVSRLRTEHQVYELPASHPLLEGFEQRQPDDPCPYLLSIWSPGETAQSMDAPKTSCNSHETGKLCKSLTCFSCSSIREVQAQKVRGTLLIPCRTAMRGSFPLNGTYFQVNEVFADHHSSQNPIDVPRSWIWNLPRRTVYFGTSVSTIFRGLTTEGIQHCFWRGFICVRGFDRTSRAPRPLYARLHFPASKVNRNKKSAAAAAPREEE